jgi:hypothetical protein
VPTDGTQSRSPGLICGATRTMFRTGSGPGASGARRGPRRAENPPENPPKTRRKTRRIRSRGLRGPPWTPEGRKPRPEGDLFGLLGGPSWSYWAPIGPYWPASGARRGPRRAEKDLPRAVWATAAVCYISAAGAVGAHWALNLINL